MPTKRATLGCMCERAPHNASPRAIASTGCPPPSKVSAVLSVQNLFLSSLAPISKLTCPVTLLLLLYEVKHGFMIFFPTSITQEKGTSLQKQNSDTIKYCGSLGFPFVCLFCTPKSHEMESCWFHSWQSCFLESIRQKQHSLHCLYPSPPIWTS